MSHYHIWRIPDHTWTGLHDWDLPTPPTPMTIETILAELAAKHGNDWPRHALSELITTAFQAAVGDIDATNRYSLLHAWTLANLTAGIAFRQTSDL